MKSKYQSILATIMLIIFGLFLLSPAPATFAKDICDNKNAPLEVRKAAGCEGTKNELPNTITIILNSIIAVTGLIAVIFIVIGGINYMTSSGESSKLDKAKKTILYACIGLVICALAFAIVNWVIGSVLKQGQQDNGNQTNSQNTTNNKTSPNAATK